MVEEKRSSFKRGGDQDLSRTEFTRDDILTAKGRENNVKNERRKRRGLNLK